MTQSISVFTLVDITDSGSVCIRDNNTKEYHQNQNLNVLIQTIGLRSQPLNYEVKIHGTTDLSEFNFDDIYSGIATVWELKFENEHLHVWNDGSDELAFLKSDINGVAISGDLDNTFYFDVDVFDLYKTINTYIKINN